MVKLTRDYLQMMDVKEKKKIDSNLILTFNASHEIRAPIIPSNQSTAPSSYKWKIEKKNRAYDTYLIVSTQALIPLTLLYTCLFSLSIEIGTSDLFIFLE